MVLLIHWRPYMRIALPAIVSLACLAVPSKSYSHSGGTDANGRHTSRKTGEYH